MWTFKRLFGTTLSMLLLMGCTSKVGQFCSRLDECGENFVGNNVEDCEVKVQELGPQLGLDVEACEDQLGAAAETDECEAFGRQNLCSLCSPILMRALLSQRWNNCGL